MNKVKTSFIKWSNSLSCGIASIDEQNKELIDMVNDMFMHETGSEEEEQNYFAGILKKTINYIKTHFTTEEKIMKAARFPGFARHKQIHNKFTIDVFETIDDFNSGRRVSLYNYTRFLKDWIFSHIAIMDKQNFEYIKRLSVCRSDIIPGDVVVERAGVFPV